MPNRSDDPGPVLLPGTKWRRYDYPDEICEITAVWNAGYGWMIRGKLFHDLDVPFISTLARFYEMHEEIE